MITNTQAIAALCRYKFGAFAHKAFEVVEPGTHYEYNWHIHCINEHLEAMFNGEIKRLIINIPPRHLKSFLVARAYPAWVLGMKPEEKFIVTSYGYEVVEQNAIACRRIMKSDWYRKLFPQTIITPDLDRNTHYETTRGGQYYAASAMSPITGIGAETLLIDDPLKPMEAYSDAIRSSTNQNIRTTLFSRLNDKRTGKICMIMQRVHEDDPTGHLLRDMGWTLVKLPAQAKTHVVIRLNEHKWEMQPNQILFPQRQSQEILDQTRLDMTEANFVAQYLQEPAPVGGGEFREEWLQFYADGSIKPKTMNVVILVDAAGGEELNKKKKKTSDWTVMAVVGLAPDNNYYLLDMVRDRLNPTERIDTLFILHRKWNELCGKPPKVGYEKYGMMTDTHYVREKQKTEAYHFPIVELGGNIMKEERIRQLIPDMQQNRWYLPATLSYVDGEGRKFDLISELKSEMASFPRARFDDILDSISRTKNQELSLTWPKPVANMVQKAYRKSRDSAPDDWCQW